ncbi:hypothetical protein BN1051_02000 [Arthrobacter saudimassiliensis]|uniref:Glycosyltransferase RgtA/B/C/D-like domain-containing protein n=1 Tax=Arthrobacter saudimassiliensis TaxID=1461584 RepID=A0A078MN34_9MICC|nr:hypothetical protein BN1051_02000 [Arthrobacter saudimassiliensis]
MLLRRIVFFMGEPAAISQTFDNIFHLNAVRYVLDTGSASSLTLGEMNGGGFYPAGWHGLVSGVVLLTGAEIPIATNMVAIAVAALVWPLGCVFLTRQIVGDRILPMLAAGVLSAAFGAFPILMLDFGVLYPNVLSISLLPIVLGALLPAVGLSGQSVSGQPVVWRWLVVLAAVPGLALAHPSTLMALLALMVPVAVRAWWRQASRIRWAERGTVMTGVLSTIVLIMGLLVLAVLWYYVRPVKEDAFWGPIESPGQAVGEVITGTQMGRPFSWSLFVLIVVGIGVLVAGRCWWLVGMFGVLGFLYVAVAGFPMGDTRWFFVGIWYNDPTRLAALIPVIAVPLTAVAATFLVQRLWILVGRKTVADLYTESSRIQRPTLAAFAGAVLMVVVLTAFTQQAPNIRYAAANAVASYQVGPDSALLNQDEMELLSRLDEKLPEDAVVVGNPWNGSGLAYALSDRESVFTHTFYEVPESAHILADRLNQAGEDPEVCAAVEELGVDYVLDFGHREVHGGDHGFDGLDDLQENGVGRVIDVVGDAKVYEITACP